jgi:tetratricopeptide (TPR) repeat protein
MTDRRTCFVVQGFGEKTDLGTGRVLNLDASYEVIKEAVEEAGLHCVRADEIVHSGTIDQPMYESLFRADLVIADLSTSNVNAAYELGVRYGVRPRATIIIAEQQFKNPFDFSHIVIRRYEHLGSDVGRKEAARLKSELVKAIAEIVNNEEVDSPVYTFLKLQPPAETARARRVQPAPGVTQGANAKALLDAARAEMTRGNFPTARALLDTVATLRPRDEYVVQQRALATYKSEMPDARRALMAARDQLLALDPDITNDPETLALWGAIHKRLWEKDRNRAHLDTAIATYERGFYIKQDPGNGINLAFLLNVRAAMYHDGDDRLEAIADFVLARRVRRDVMRYAQQAIEKAADADTKYWATATLWEAAAGVGDDAESARWRAEAEALAPAPWMLETTRKQVERLDRLLADAVWLNT